MKRALRLLARAYPRSWRRRYGREFDALLEQLTPTAGDVLDVARGGIVTRIRSAHPAVLAVTLSIVGGMVAGAIADVTSHRVESTMALTFQRDAGADAVRDGATVLDLADRALDAGFMASLGDVSEVQRNTRITVNTAAPTVLHLSFASDDSNRSQALVDRIARRVIEGALTARESGSLPAGTLRVLSGPSQPRASASPTRILTACAIGIGLGLLCGLISTRFSSAATQHRSNF